jgi:hypothetical protein
VKQIGSFASALRLSYGQWPKAGRLTASGPEAIATGIAEQTTHGSDGLAELLQEAIKQERIYEQFRG